MKSIVQIMAVMTSLVLLAGCGGGGGGSTPVPPTAPPPPQMGVDGQAVKGIITGATISVIDGNGRTISIASGLETDDDGRFSALFSSADVAAGIVAPLQITIDVSGATLICDWDVEGDDDCPVGDGTFVSFGDTYQDTTALTMAAFSPLIPLGEPAVTVNINPITDLALSIASRSNDVDPATVEEAYEQVRGLVEFAGSLDLAGVDLRTLDLIDLTSVSTETLTAENIAISVLGASVIGQIDVNDPELDSVREVIDRIAASIELEGEELVATGTVMAALASGLATGGEIINAQLEAAGLPANSDVVVLIEQSSDNADLFELAGDNPVSTDTDVDTLPVVQTKAFVADLSMAINAILEATGAENFGGSQLGATEVFADELYAIQMMSSMEATMAYKQLQYALVDAEASLAAGESVTLSGDVSGTVSLSPDGSTMTVADINSSYAGENGIAVTIDMANGWRSESGSAFGPSLNATDVTMVTWDNGSVVQTFTGSFSVAFAPEGEDDLGLSAASFDGAISVADQPGSFSVNATLSDITGTADQDAGTNDIQGNYTASLSFGDGTHDLNVGMNGALHGYMQAFSISAGGTTVWGTASRDGNIDTDVLTDMKTTLTLVLDFSGPGQLVSGVFTVNGEQTATMDDTGTVYFEDGSIQSLPAAIF